MNNKGVKPVAYEFPFEIEYEVNKQYSRWIFRSKTLLNNDGEGRVTYIYYELDWIILCMPYPDVPINPTSDINIIKEVIHQHWKKYTYERKWNKTN